MKITLTLKDQLPEEYELLPIHLRSQHWTRHITPLLGKKVKVECFTDISIIEKFTGWDFVLKHRFFKEDRTQILLKFYKEKKKRKWK